MSNEVRSGYGVGQPPAVVVGAGPVGTTAAVALAAKGVPVVLVESAAEPLGDWRASTFHPSTMELLAGLGLGITEQMLETGLPVPKFQYRDRHSGLIAELDLGLLAEETRYPFRLQLNQQHLVRILVDRLRGMDGVQLLFGSSLRGFTQDDTGVTATIETLGGTTEITGSFLIGADGAASTVRTLLGVDFDGQTYAERFVIVSTEADFGELLPGIAHVNYISDPEQWVFLLRTPESWRAVYPVPADTPRETVLEPEALQRELQAIAPLPAGYPILDSQIYNVHQRVAAQFRAGRVALIGDAAHINSPLGGVGLNSGIHDALDLTERIARAHRGSGGDIDIDAELDAFAAVRRRVALEYIRADTHRNTERMKETDPVLRAHNQAELQATAADPERARAWMRRSSLLESVRRYGVGRPPEALADLLEPSGVST
jgi:2-polyprenyl-6-methoxyphenol hydroxylase-like FAD-dependent oxidoreductase